MPNYCWRKQSKCIFDSDKRFEIRRIRYIRVSSISISVCLVMQFPICKNNVEEALSEGRIALRRRVFCLDESFLSILCHGHTLCYKSRTFLCIVVSQDRNSFIAKQDKKSHRKQFSPSKNAAYERRYKAGAGPSCINNC